VIAARTSAIIKGDVANELQLQVKKIFVHDWIINTAMFLDQCINCIQLHVLHTNTRCTFTAYNTKHVALVCRWCIYLKKNDTVAAPNKVVINVNRYLLIESMMLFFFQE